jgi:hypothetical protein
VHEAEHSAKYPTSPAGAASAHICENDRVLQSTLISPTRLADRAFLSGSITLDVVRRIQNSDTVWRSQKTSSA